jgi:nucleotide-binding universal stress UspA family protein
MWGHHKLCLFSKVLVPVDGSENSLRALNTAVFLSRRIELQLTALNVMENPSTVYLQSPKISTDQIDNYKRESEAILEKCKEIANKNGIKIQTVLMEGGNAAPKIIQYGEKENFDTIIMSHSGMSGFKKMLLGSVSNQLINQTKKCTVVILK